MLLFSLIGCSSLKPEFDQDVFPENYHFPDNLTGSSAPQSPPHINRLELSQTQDIINLWADFKFKSIYQQNHPILGYNRDDIVDLYYHLVESFDIYYISQIKYQSLADKKNLVNQTKCQPLSNFEIKFILNNGSISTISSIRLTLLIISLHEAMLRKGFIPLYPKIRSAYLRKRYHKLALRSSEDFNVIDKHKNLISSNFYPYYFLFCRKDVSD